MPKVALVVGQDRIDRSVIEIKHLLVGIAIVVLDREIRQRRADRRAVALRHEMRALVDRLLRLDKAFLRVGFVVERQDFHLLAVQSARGVDLIGELLKVLQSDLADRGAAA